MSSTVTAAAAPARPCGGARKGRNGATKKQPQRGLGVAQLEKLRLQEQQAQCKDFTFVGPIDQHPHQVLDRSIPLGLIPAVLPQQQWPLLPMQQPQLQQAFHRASLVSQISSGGLSWAEREPFKDMGGPCSKTSLPRPSSFSFEKSGRVDPYPTAAAAAAAISISQAVCSRSPSPALPRQQQQMEFAVLGSDPFRERKSKELSSFQIDHHQQQHWTLDDKTTLSSQRKRPRLEMWLRPNNMTPPHGSNLDNPLGSLSPPVEKPVMLATLLEKDDHQTDKTHGTGTSLNESATPSATVVNNSCSTVSSSPVVSERRPHGTGGLAEVEIESAPLSDFLTLGLASSSSKRNGGADLHQQLTGKSQQKDGTWLNWIRIGGKTANGFTDGVSVDLNLRLSM